MYFAVHDENGVTVEAKLHDIAANVQATHRSVFTRGKECTN